MIGVSQVINKKISGSNHHSKTHTTVVMLMNTVISVPLLFFQFSLTTSIFTWLLIVISVVVYAFSTYFGFQAYKKTDVSLVAIIQRTSIVFTALIGILLLGESYSFQAYIGLLFIFLSGIIITYKKSHLKFDEGVLFAFLMALAGSIAAVLDKIILNDFSPYTYVFVNNLLVTAVFGLNRGRVREVVSVLKTNFWSVFLTALLWTGSFLLVSIVLKETDVSRTMPIYKTLGLITPVLIGITFLNEKQMLREKVAGIILGSVGIVLMHWN